MRNPLVKRIPKELASDWHKYLVIVIFMVLMIGVISGMYVGHDSMIAAINRGREELKIEDGSFELSERASEELLEAISSGEKADVRQYFIDKGISEADKEVAKAVEDELQKQVRTTIEDAVREQCAAYGITDEQMIQEQIDSAMEAQYDNALKEARNSEEFKEAVEDAYEEAHNAVIEEVDEKWNDIEDQYGLNDGDFHPVQITIYEDFYHNASEDNDNDGIEDATVRIFRKDSEINGASFIDGRAPESESEIAIDRMHADNVGVKIGDTITVDGRKFEIVGLLSYVHYLTLHENNTDLMFDAFGFDVAMLTGEAFDDLPSRLHYNYSYMYDVKPADKIEKADCADNLLKSLITQTLVYDNEIDDFLPEYLRQASNFAPTDLESDSAGTSIMCYILIAVIAFIFAITISNTIEKEASVIGTLRASGYSREELTVHYMSMPLIVTIAGAVIGNILGYTAFRKMAIYLYYNSYSMPECGIEWSPVALVKTTIIPLLLMFFINLFIIARKLQLSPLKFLRHDLAKNRRSKARRIPAWSFLRRFRIRILFQNMPNYAVLIFGVIFIELMLCFAFGLPDSLNHYGDRAADMVFADYQYMLMRYKDEDGNIIETSEPTAERFSSTSLLYPKTRSSVIDGMGSGGDESVTVYGIADDSTYVDIPGDLASGNVYVSSAFVSKFGLKNGDVITLHEEYENKSYEFTVAGITDYDGGIAVFMNNGSFAEVFDKKADGFSGYFSRNEITDIDAQDIAVVITTKDITKITNQLMHSMGGFMDIFKYTMVVLAAALIYLLAKIIIERNEHSISMVKILGFKNSEIGSLYITPTAVIVTVFSVISFVVGYFLMIWIFQAVMMQMDGYFAFYMTPVSMVLSVVYLLIGYAFVSVIDFIRIKKIPMDVALKNVE
ncbi:putative ABC transport system permease protein [Ruminococcaceae bacterium YRB3002]|nr:putative ABC transport system permease protein [Ruminococcaceae bacterium YRB3002]